MGICESREHIFDSSIHAPFGNRMSTSPEATVLYRAPTRSALELTTNGALPPCPPGHIRVVCIADTHNEHEGLSLPLGHLLIHAGDVLTESGKRYVERGRDGGIRRVSPDGISLVERFAAWLGAQPHPHKVVIGGNHDLVLAGLGAATVRAMLSNASGGTAMYLEHESAALDGGALRVFGSPRASWGSKNNAFLTAAPDWTAVRNETHIVVTHMPPILPSGGRTLEEDTAVAKALHRAGALLHVGGHCHWAHGLYHSSSGVPSVVASVSGSWEFGRGLRPGPSGVRGDRQGDARFGGYNLENPPIVCDIKVPGGPPRPDARWAVEGALALPQSVAPSIPVVTAHEVEILEAGTSPKAPAGGRPRLLLFCPPHDSATRVRLEHALADAYDVCHFNYAADAIEAISATVGGDTSAGGGATSSTLVAVAFAACVVKLGTRGNSGVDVLKALRSHALGAGCVSRDPLLVVHSATAVGHHATAAFLRDELGVAAVVGHSNEADAIPLLLEHAAGWSS